MFAELERQGFWNEIQKEMEEATIYFDKEEYCSELLRQIAIDNEGQTISAIDIINAETLFLKKLLTARGVKFYEVEVIVVFNLKTDKVKIKWR